jgi:ATP-dependent Clp protease protease subunit
MTKKYNIKNALNGDAEIDIFGDIDSWWGYNLNQLRYDLSAVQGNDLTVNISTYGGDAFEALAIGGVLDSLQKNVTTIGYGVVASAGTVILLAGKKRKMAANSFFMIHNPTAVTGGEASEMRKTADLLDKIQTQLVDIYVTAIEKSGKLIDGSRETTAKKVQKWVEDETWFTADEALQYGFIDEITEPVEFITPTTATEIKNSIAAYQKVPAQITNKLSEMENPKENTNTNNNGGIIEAIKNLFVSAGLIKNEADTVADAPKPETKTTEFALESVITAAAESKVDETQAIQKEKTELLEKLEQLTKKVADLEAAKPQSLLARTPEPAAQTAKNTIPKDEAEQWGKLINPILNKLN